MSDKTPVRNKISIQ